jgi:hypothetical protein
MMQIYIAPSGYSMNEDNPFSLDGKYDRSWTILTIDSNVQGMLFQQRSRHGCYAVSMTPQYAFFNELFADFIQYETDHVRKIILVSKDDMNLDFKTHYKDSSIRPSDSRFLIHSTTLPTYEKILSDGLLKSPHRLKREGYEVHPIGLEPLGEPDDYLDHIMFANSGVAPELVVNSRLCGGVNYDLNAPYLPQARLYFDGLKMVSDGLIVRNVASMVFDSLPLEPYLLKTVVADNLQIPDGNPEWTPFSFAKCADDFMKNSF